MAWMCLLGAASAVRADIQLPLPVTVPEKLQLTEERRAYAEIQVKRLAEAQRVYADVDSSARAADYTWAILGGLLAAILLAYVIFTWNRTPGAPSTGVTLMHGTSSRSLRHRSHKQSTRSSNAHAAGALQSMLSLLGGSSSRRHRGGHRSRSSRKGRRRRHRDGMPIENHYHGDDHAPSESHHHDSFHDGFDDASDA